MKLAKCILLGMSIWLSGMILAQSTLDYPLDTIEGQVYYRYTVERSIGLYRISKNFGVSQEAILQANPHLQTMGLRYDEVILVPAYNLHTESRTSGSRGEKRREEASNQTPLIPTQEHKTRYYYGGRSDNGR